MGRWNSGCHTNALVADPWWLHSRHGAMNPFHSTAILVLVPVQECQGRCIGYLYMFSLEEKDTLPYARWRDETLFYVFDWMDGILPRFPWSRNPKMPRVIYSTPILWTSGNSWLSYRDDFGEEGR